MCRAVAYLGTPLLLGALLYDSDSSLVRQAYDPAMLHYMNLAGCGVAAWDAASPDPREPYLYKDPSLPMYDRNLLLLGRKVRTDCLIAHLRGESYFGGAVPRVARANLHPFLYDDVGVALAHNGGLARFADYKYDLVPHIARPVLAQIEGTTDSEWIYALYATRLLARRPTSAQRWSAEDLAGALVDTLAILRRVRQERGVVEVSGANIFVGDGDTIVSTRFSFDFGCASGPLSVSQLEYPSLWYTVGRDYGCHDGMWQMRGTVQDGDSILLASEPLTKDTSSWFEVPEYTIVTAQRTADGRVAVSASDLSL